MIDGNLSAILEARPMATATQVVYTAEEFVTPDPGYPEKRPRKDRCDAAAFPRHVKCAVKSTESWAAMQTNMNSVTSTNDSGVITRRGPDTVRGADVSFCS
jgi:hypothetical protein